MSFFIKFKDETAADAIEASDYEGFEEHKDALKEATEYLNLDPGTEFSIVDDRGYVHGVYRMTGEDSYDILVLPKSSLH